MCGGAGLCLPARAATGHVLIATASREAPYAAATEGIQRALASHSIASEILQLPADAAASRPEVALRPEVAPRPEVKTGSAQLAIAVGIDAVRAIAALRGRVPVVVTMCFHSDMGNAEPGELGLAGALWLEMPLALVVAGLRLIFPEADRIAVVQGTSQPDTGETPGHPRSLPAGVSLQTVECAGPSELLASLRKLRGKADCVICLPDGNLYNKTTVEPLILASLEHKLPLVGYSASFVRAGAALGVYPDFSDIGEQTAALAERVAGNAPAVLTEHPRRAIVAANERVLHLLGRDYRPKPGDPVVVVR